MFEPAPWSQLPNPPQPDPMRMVQFSSIPLGPGGGDTHIHPFGPSPSDFTVTTRFPLGGGLGTFEIHDFGPNPDFHLR